ncbi:quinoprotein dehydrogenase-associated putative ABC transporter substrate-binding protein [Noviherbaspirillum suwonense]|jgi:quinoprotein dehydrogenase-associated probable ABC transporter substrate-binding protein|uniref:Amino acid ABC transporter substrate-binding protein, PAAT family n=1 Tax=Noviherbaspirillum suwonense TaxID=1224511 RepID=A0ABY1PUQ5_9BURK|nr:quinoprotein dehydrogenase-associated putative ABC transporter substrate-binding protein [Noviherbaspirillum suwonense]SMP47921.1 amino acid ABC transporter substrate-binding protein, PAAT family [Noviherbaspirillum suwonense]
MSFAENGIKGGGRIRIRLGSLLQAAALAAAAAFMQGAQAQDDGGAKVLRVCQDPNNLPFSSRDGRGLENRIAALFADKLGWKLEHTWYPQRIGFVRNTLRAKVPDTDHYKCDLITGVATGFELGLTTRPYYRSTYALAYVKGRGLDSVQTPEDLLKLDPAVLRKLKIGAFSKSPAVDWLLRNGLIDQMVPYQHQTGDPDQYPGQIIDRDLVNGTVDVAMAWGPIVGYFAKQSTARPIAVVPFMPDSSGLKYDFSIAMAVRHGDKALRDRIDGLIAASGPEIKALLDEYGVPSLPVKED